MTTRSAACSLAIKGAAFPWAWKPGSQAPPHPHRTLPHQLQALPSCRLCDCRTHGSWIWLSPCALPNTPALSRQG